MIYIGKVSLASTIRLGDMAQEVKGGSKGNLIFGHFRLDTTVLTYSCGLAPKGLKRCGIAKH